MALRSRRGVRRLILAAVLALGACAGPAQQRADDFDEMWRFVRDGYPYFAEKRSDWDAVRLRYRGPARRAADKDKFIAVLERALDELYDPHSHLGVNLASSWRLPPHDLWAEWEGGQAVIRGVKRGSAAARAGLRPRMVVELVDGRPVREAMAERLPATLRAPDPEADGFALRSLLAGRHDRDRRFTVRDAGGGRRELTIHDDDKQEDRPAIEGRLLGDGFGYIRISTFGDGDAVEAFDNALEVLRDTRGLIIDVRDNPGGDTSVAVPMMGRFIAAAKQYVWMTRRQAAGFAPRWPEIVEPRGPFTYTAPLVVLCDHFSESMAEGFAVGLDGMHRATVVGTPMAGLGAGIARRELKHSGIAVQISAEPVFHVDGSPRERYAPPVPVEESGEGDDILRVGLETLARLAR